MPLKESVNERYLIRKGITTAVVILAGILFMVYYVQYIGLEEGLAFPDFQSRIALIFSSWAFLGVGLDLWVGKEAAEIIDVWSLKHSFLVFLFAGTWLILQVLIINHVIIGKGLSMEMLQTVLSDLLLFIIFVGIGYVPYVDAIW